MAKDVNWRYLVPSGLCQVIKGLKEVKFKLPKLPNEGFLNA